MKGWLPRLGLLAAASWLALAPASAQTVEQFYRGKTMTIMLGHPPGGSYGSLCAARRPITSSVTSLAIPTSLSSTGRAVAASVPSPSSTRSRRATALSWVCFRRALRIRR